MLRGFRYGGASTGETDGESYRLHRTLLIGGRGYLYPNGGREIVFHKGRQPKSLVPNQALNLENKSQAEHRVLSRKASAGKGQNDRRMLNHRGDDAGGTESPDSDGVDC